MIRSSFLLRKAREAANRRKNRYRTLAPRSVRKIFAAEEDQLGFPQRLRLIVYLLFGGLALRLKAIWYYAIDRDTPNRRAEVAGLKQEMVERLEGLGEGGQSACRVQDGYFERRLYSRDLAPVPGYLEKLLLRTTPDLVVQPKNEQDIAEIFRFATKKKLGVHPRGAGSSPFGGAVPTRNGIALDLSQMARIIRIDPENRTVIVEPGVRWGNLAERLAVHGLRPTTNPTSRFSTVGGWAQSGGLGLHGFKYGHLKNAILAVKAVLPRGETIRVQSGDLEFARLIGAEGQLAVLTELTLKVRPVSSVSRPTLIPFDSPKTALDFLGAIVREAKTRGEPFSPSHAAFVDRHRMVEENRLFADRTGISAPIVPETDALLLHFDDQESETRFFEWLSEKQGGPEPVKGPAASYFWAERYFPLKAARLGPNLLGAEVLLPLSATAEFVERASKVAQGLGINPAFEAICSRVDGEATCVVIASFPADAKRAMEYSHRLVAVQLLVMEGVRCGGKPYGVGIWNAALVETHHPAEHLTAMRRIKGEWDPAGILNPHKFFSVGSRLWNLPGRLLFSPRLFGFWMGLAAPFANAIASFAGGAVRHKEKHNWTVPTSEVDRGRSLLEQASQRCTFCGACVATCPAYQITGDELVTGRSKLLLAQARFDGETVSRADAFIPFQCIRCGLCEQVCQTRLPLRECYDLIESRVVDQYGTWPRQQAERFVATVDKNREWICRTFGLDAPDWAPETMTRAFGPSKNTPAKDER
jgi:glycolate dehydrogenase FAD-linked subunit